MIRSFSVPALNRKIDMIPGLHNQVSAGRVEDPGVYRGQCSQFCGLQHAHMAMYVYAPARGEVPRLVGEHERPRAHGDERLGARSGACS